MKNRFDLEQEFMECWSMTEDLQSLYELCEQITEPTLADQFANSILGIKSVYDTRFQRAWKTFEEVVQNKGL